MITPAIGLCRGIILQRSGRAVDGAILPRSGFVQQVNQLRAFGAGQLTLRFASFQLPVIETLGAYGSEYSELNM